MKFTKEQPKDGDIVLHCGHPETGNHHFFKIQGTVNFVRPDNTSSTLTEPWLIVCEDCLTKSFGDPLQTIRGEATWKGDEPFVQENDEKES